MKILINYADENYRSAQRINSVTGYVFGKFDKVFSFGPNNIDSVFYKRNKYILNKKRGNGLWLWKPYFINKVLEECNEGDYVFYLDSGAFFLRKVDYLIQSMEADEYLWVSNIPLLEMNFTNPSCFMKMGCDEKKYYESNQIQAGFILVKCCSESKQFIKQWLQLCEDRDLLDPDENEIEYKSDERKFVSHREDQSILSLLCKKNGINPHRDPSQRGNFPWIFYNSKYKFRIPKHKDKYNTIIFLHKRTSISFIEFLVLYFKEFLVNIKRQMIYGKNV